MADFKIHIGVDPYTRDFRYTYNGAPAKTIRLNNGSRIIWVLDESLKEQTFQIDFGVLNPFQVGKAVSFRGDGFVVSSTVNLPTNYVLNRQFKYSVFLGNGWRDAASPVLVVPEPPDPGASVVVFVVPAPPPPGTVYITWANNETDISLNPLSSPPTPPPPVYPPITVVSSGNPAAAMVTWQWDPGVVDPEPFTVQLFNSNNALWPTAAIPDQEGSVSLSLPPGAAGFTITTTTPAQVTKAQNGGVLVT